MNEIMRIVLLHLDSIQNECRMSGLILANDYMCMFYQMVFAVVCY